jgi:ubiquinone/menaquinone biosynthesis C-methylase UbiE
MDNKSYYNEFSEWYDRDRAVGYHAMIDGLELRVALPLAKGARVLEVGCGTGLILQRLASVAEQAEGVDLSPKMLDRARTRGLTVREASATELPFRDGEFTLVCSFKVLAHVEQIRTAMDEMARVLAPGGTILAEFYNPWSLRYLAKRFGPAGQISRSTDESAVFTRYDSPRAIRALVPDGCELVQLHGVRTVTPAAAVFKWAPVGALFERVECLVQSTPLAHVAGFVIAEMRKR